MGDFGVDTAVSGADGVYTATLNDDWEIWGPNGGYVAAIALRAAGAESRFDRPANCAVQFLGVAAFDEVTCTVEMVKRTRRADVLRVLMTQGDRLILQLSCWAVTRDLADERHVAVALTHPPPHEVPTVLERLEAAGIEPTGPPFPFWNNFEQRPIDFIAKWEERGALEPSWASWLKYEPTAVTDDPWIEAARVLLLADVGSWPAAHRAFTPAEVAGWYAPSLDVACHFTDLDTTDWLLAAHTSPASRDGLMSSTSNIWSSDGRILASGVSQLIVTPTAPTADLS